VNLKGGDETGVVQGLGTDASNPQYNNQYKFTDGKNRIKETIDPTTQSKSDGTGTIASNTVKQTHICVCICPGRRGER
jgi:hypothetical protein